MHTKNAIMPVVLVAALCITTNLQALDLSSAWYAGAGIGGSQVSLQTAGSGLVVSDDSDYSWQVFAGYRFNQNLSLELSYVDLGKAKLAVARTGAPAGNVSFKQTTFGALWSPVMQDQPSWRPFLKGGVNYSNHDRNVGPLIKDETSGFVGAGIEKFFAGGEYSMRAEYTVYTQDANSFQLNFVKYFLD